MSKADEHINPFVVNAIYLFQKGGPTLMAMVSLLWVVYIHTTQFQAAVLVLTQNVSANTTALQNFITKVKEDHDVQIKAISQLKAQLEKEHYGIQGRTYSK